MIRFFFAVTVVSVFIFSCSSKKDKNDSLTDEAVVEEVVTEKEVTKEIGEKESSLVYLDTAENIYNILCQDWVITEDAEALEGMTENSQLVIPYRSICLSTKGTFLRNPRNNIDYGTWQYNDATKTIVLNDAVDRTKDIYKIARITYDELILVNVGLKSETNLKFISPGKRYKDPEDEPYYIENNRWRIRPKKQEDEAAIYKRLKENIRFFILFYRSAIAKDDKTVSFWGLPSCFKWYGGGIYLKKEDELKDNWIDCFYDKEQAMQAYALADKLLSQKYNWPKGEQNWLKLNLAVVEMMYKKMDEIK